MTTLINPQAEMFPGILAPEQVLSPVSPPVGDLPLVVAPEQGESRSTALDRSPPTQPRRVAFLLTSMPVGGAETLLMNLMRSFSAAAITPEICCLKERGPLGEELASEFPVTSNYITHKRDVAVVGKLAQRFRERNVQAVITVGAGDKMFWGRIAARYARVPVVLSALHSTGWPDGIGRLNRLLTPWTDGFIAVAEDHGRYLVKREWLPSDKVFVIPNGIDTDRFRPNATSRQRIREELQIDDATPLCGIVAALRPEKNHRLFLRMAQQVRADRDVRFAIIGDGPARTELVEEARRLELTDYVNFLGSRPDIPELLSALDLFCLTSDNEANPVSILEALATEVPVVATNVGSVAANVKDGETGILVPPGDPTAFAQAVSRLLGSPDEATQFGRAGRQHVVQTGSLLAMVSGYEQLIGDLHQRFLDGSPLPASGRAYLRAEVQPGIFKRGLTNRNG